MKTVIVKFVVQNQDEANALMRKISDIGTYNDYPFLESSIEPSKPEEIKAHKEMMD